jgi:hypothetical protein
MGLGAGVDREVPVDPVVLALLFREARHRTRPFRGAWPADKGPWRSGRQSSFP